MFCKHIVKQGNNIILSEAKLYLNYETKARKGKGKILGWQHKKIVKQFDIFQ